MCDELTPEDLELNEKDLDEILKNNSIKKTQSEKDDIDWLDLDSFELL